MIERLVITNWRSHSRSELDFSPGTNVLLGIMGAGKSSVLSALCFALFGETPDVRARRARLDDLILSKPFPAAEAAVELVFSAGGKKYSVTRRIVRGEGSAEAELREDGRLIEGPQPAKVTAAISSLLGIDYDLFMQAVYLEQNQLDAFLSAPRARRREKLDEFFGISRLEDARTTLLAALAELRAEAAVLGRDDAAGRLAEKKAAAGKLSAELSSLETELSEKKAALAETSKAERAKRSEIARLEEESRELTNLAARKSAASRQLAEIKDKLSKYLEVGSPDSKEKLAALEEERKQVGKLFLQLAGIRSELAAAAADSKKLLAALSALPVISGDLEKAFQAAEKKAREASGRLAGKRELLKDLLAKRELARRKKTGLGKDVADELEGAQARLETAAEAQSAKAAILASQREAVGLLAAESAECPVCGSELGHAKACGLRKRKEAAISRLEAELETLSKEKASLQKKVASLKKADEIFAKQSAEISSLEKQAAGAEKLAGQVSEQEALSAEAELEFAAAREAFEAARERVRIGREASENSARLAALAAQRDSTEERLAGRTPESLDAGIARARRLSESFELADEAGKAEKEISAIAESEKGHPGFSEGALAAARSELLALSARRGSLESFSASLPARISEKRLLLDSIEKEVAGLTSLSERKLRVGKALERGGALERAIRETEELLRAELVGDINSALASVWRSVYPYDDYSGLRLKADEQDYLLELRAKDWIEVERIASGGERALSCLALRIAFARVLAPQLRLLILDEPTHNLDSNGIASLVSVLRERISDLVDQTILITHEEELEAAATGSCYRLEKGDATQVKLLSAGEL